jgi:hypothetical protein
MKNTTIKNSYNWNKELSVKEKIERLNFLKKENYKNIGRPFNNKKVIGLCETYMSYYNREIQGLAKDIPELKEGVFVNYGYWWTSRGFFMPFLSRHVAILKAIKKIKNQKVKKQETMSDKTKIINYIQSINHQPPNLSSQKALNLIREINEKLEDWKKISLKEVNEKIR